MTGPLHPMHLAEAAVARLCHDLSGSLGTVLNALDLADTDADIAAEALALAADASRDMANRLRLVRMLWGRDGVADLDTLLALSAGLPNRGRLTLHTTDLTGGTFPPATGRLLLGLLIVAAESLHGPGSIIIAGNPDDLTLTIDGPRAAWPEDLAALAIGRDDLWQNLDPRSLAPRLAVLLAHDAGVTMSLLSPTAPGTSPPRLRVRR